MVCLECKKDNVEHGIWYAMIQDVCILFYRSALYYDLLKSIKIEHNSDATHIEILPNITYWVDDVARHHINERDSHSTNTRDVVTELILKFVKNEIPYKIIYCNCNDGKYVYSESNVYNEAILVSKVFAHNVIPFPTIIKSDIIPVTLGQPIELFNKAPFNKDTYVRCIKDNDSFYSGHMEEYNVNQYNEKWTMRKGTFTNEG